MPYAHAQFRNIPFFFFCRLLFRDICICEKFFFSLFRKRSAFVVQILSQQTVDKIWRAAGDRSTDFNFYTKRMLLGAVYTSTLLFWLDDSSYDNSATWKFLDRRINDVMKLQTLRSNLARRVQTLQPIFSRFFESLNVNR